MDLIIGLLFHFLTAAGLYQINKKGGEKNPWISWIPFANIYSFSTAGKKELSYILYPVLAYLGFQVLIVLFTFSIGSISPQAIMITTSVLGVLGLIILVWLLVKWARLTTAISKRVGYGQGMAVGLFFLPFIFYPVVGYKFKPKSDEVVDLGGDTQKDDVKNIEL